MDASLETLVIAGYVFATSFSIPRPGPQGLVTDHELMGEHANTPAYNAIAWVTCGVMIVLTAAMLFT